jgi:hypothetical protein
MLERIVNAAALGVGRSPQFNENMDLFFETPDGWVIAEMKSCRPTNVHAQVRRGVSQLLEYAFVYRDDVGENPTRLLVLESEPPEPKRWIADYLASLGILLAWKVSGEDRIETTMEIPPALRGIISERD